MQTEIPGVSLNVTDSGGHLPRDSTHLARCNPLHNRNLRQARTFEQGTQDRPLQVAPEELP
jgi:hypothetical protein